MECVAQFVDQELADPFRNFRRRAFAFDDLFIAVRLALLESRGRHKFPVPALVPRSTGIEFSMIAATGRIVEKLIDQSRRRRELSDDEGLLPHAFESGGERLHMRDLSR